MSFMIWENKLWLVFALLLFGLNDNVLIIVCEIADGQEIPLQIISTSQEFCPCLVLCCVFDNDRLTHAKPREYGTD